MVQDVNMQFMQFSSGFLHHARMMQFSSGTAKTSMNSYLLEREFKIQHRIHIPHPSNPQSSHYFHFASLKLAPSIVNTLDWNHGLDRSSPWIRLGCARCGVSSSAPSTSIVLLLPLVRNNIQKSNVVIVSAYYYYSVWIELHPSSQACTWVALWWKLGRNSMYRTPIFMVSAYISCGLICNVHIIIWHGHLACT